MNTSTTSLIEDEAPPVSFSEAERLTMLRTFKRFDVDGSNSIDISELRLVMENLGVRMNRQQLVDLVEQANVNEKGELEFDAFAELLSIWKDAAKLKVFDHGFNSKGGDTATRAGEVMQGNSEADAHTSSSTSCPETNNNYSMTTEHRLAERLRCSIYVSDSFQRTSFNALVAVVTCTYWTLLLNTDIRKGLLFYYAWLLFEGPITTICFAADFFLSFFTYLATATDLKTSSSASDLNLGTPAPLMANVARYMCMCACRCCSCFSYAQSSKAKQHTKGQNAQMNARGRTAASSPNPALTAATLKKKGRRISQTSVVNPDDEGKIRSDQHITDACHDDGNNVEKQDNEKDAIPERAAFDVFIQHCLKPYFFSGFLLIDLFCVIPFKLILSLLFIMPFNRGYPYQNYAAQFVLSNSDVDQSNHTVSAGHTNYTIYHYYHQNTNRWNIFYPIKSFPLVTTGAVGGEPVHLKYNALNQDGKAAAATVLYNGIFLDIEDALPVVSSAPGDTPSAPAGNTGGISRTTINVVVMVGFILSHVRGILKIYKVIFIFKESGRMPMSGSYITLHFKIIPVTALFMLFLVVVHTFTIGFIALKQYNNNDDLLEYEDYWFPDMSPDANGFDATNLWLTRPDNYNETAGTVPSSDSQRISVNTEVVHTMWRNRIYTYDAGLYFVMYSFCTVGYGNIKVKGMAEKWFACLVLVGTLLCNGYIVGRLVATLQQADVQSDRRGKLRQTLSVLQHFQLPEAMQDEILRFQEHLLAHSLSASYSSIIQGLPQEMVANINIVVKLRLLSGAQMFKGLHDVVKVALAQRLTNRVVVPAEYVLAIGETCTTLYFIAHGYVDVMLSSQMVGMQSPGGKQHAQSQHTLGHGDYFGAGALLLSLAKIQKNELDEQRKKLMERDQHQMDDDHADGGETKKSSANTTGSPPSSPVPPPTFYVSTASYKSVGYCEMLCLGQQDIQLMAERFPKFRRVILEYQDRAESELFCTPSSEDASQSMSSANMVDVVAEFMQSRSAMMPPVLEVSGEEGKNSSFSDEAARSTTCDGRTNNLHCSDHSLIHSQNRHFSRTRTSKAGVSRRNTLIRSLVGLMGSKKRDDMHENMISTPTTTNQHLDAQRMESTFARSLQESRRQQQQSQLFIEKSPPTRRFETSPHFQPFDDTADNTDNATCDLDQLSARMESACLRLRRIQAQVSKK